MGFFGNLSKMAKAKQEAKIDRKAQKLENKHEEKLAKYQSLNVAYSNGIQPTNAGDVISDVVGSVVSGATTIFSKKFTGGTPPIPGANNVINSGSGMMIPILLIVAVFLLPKMLK